MDALSHLSQLPRELGAFLWRQKSRLLLLLPITLLCMLWLTPVGDLRGWLLTSILPRSLPPQWSVDFAKLSLHPGFPLAVRLSELDLIAPQLPRIKVGRVTYSPSLLQSALNKLPLGHLNVEDVFGAQAEVSLKMREKLDVEGSLNSLPLAQVIRDFSPYPIPLEGQLNASLKGSIDPKSFIPLINADLTSSPITMGSTTVSGFTLPQLKFSSLTGKLNFDGQKLTLTDVSLGSDQDGLNSKINGDVTLSPGRFALNLSMSLRISNTMMAELERGKVTSALTLIDSCKRPTATGRVYNFRIRFAGFPSLPECTGG
jgi:type II secretion system protein N